MESGRPTEEGRLKYESLRKSRDRTHLCNAPVTNLYFRTDGLAVPCWLQTGDGVTNKWSTNNSIRAIWDSTPMTQLRTDLAAGEMNGMCWLCKQCVDTGTRPLALAYEDVEPNPGYRYPSMIELELSNHCNLECVMCQGSLSHLIRKNREHLPALPMAYDDAFVQELREFIPHLQELRFNGGEPFTQQIVFDICDVVAEIRPDLQITVATNGTVINERVRRALGRNNFRINISIDSLHKDRYEAIRIRADFDVLMTNFLEFKEYCLVNERVLSVQVNPMRHNWDEMGEIMAWATNHNVHCWYNIVRYPLHSAIWNLPSDEIERIRETLAATVFERDASTPDWVWDNNMTVWSHLIDDQLTSWVTEQRQREVDGEHHADDPTVPLTIGRKPTNA